MASRDIKVKYKQSALGPLWLLIQPFGLLAAITLAFSGVTKAGSAGVPYVLFGLVGICVWNFISMTLSVSAQAFVNNSTLIRRSPAPRLAFITSTVLSNGPLLGLMLLITVVASIGWHGPAPRMAVVVVLLAWLLVFCWGLVLLIAPVATRFRDAIAIVPLLVQAGMFVSPVGYDPHSAPHNIGIILDINPITGLIEAWRWVLLGISPDLAVIGISAGWTALLLLVGWRVFVRMEYRLADFV